MSFHYLLVGMFMLLNSFLYGQELISYNARSFAMSGISVILPDVWSTVANQAYLAFCRNPLIGINCTNQYLITDLNTESVVGLIDVFLGGMALSVTNFGNSSYNEKTLTLGYGRKISKFIYSGIGLHYFHRSFGSLKENNSNISGDLGVLIMPFEELNIGLQVIHISKSTFTAENTAGLRFGFSYSEKDENYLVGTELDLENFKSLSIRAGLEFQTAKFLLIRLGIKVPATASFSFGFGMKIKKIQIDMGFEDHMVLGLSSSISCIMQLGKNGN